MGVVGAVRKVPKQPTSERFFPPEEGGAAERDVVWGAAPRGVERWSGRPPERGARREESWGLREKHPTKAVFGAKLLGG